MNVVVAFIILVILVIVISIALHLSRKFDSPDPLTDKKSLQSDIPKNAYLPNPAWSKPSMFPPDGSGSAVCSIYTFLAGEDLPAVPSYSGLQGSGGRGFIFTPGPTGNQSVCIDVDQLFANTISHECVAPYSNGAGAGCILSVQTAVPQTGGGYISLPPGEIAPKGTVEGVIYPDAPPGFSQKYYAPCTPNNLGNTVQDSSYCIGNIGLLIPNFTPQAVYDPPDETSRNNCLGGNTQLVDTNGSYNVDLLACDLSDQEQIFRMIRYSMDSQFNITQDDNGNLAAIVHRASGYYLGPELTPQPIVKIVGVTGATGTVDPRFPTPSGEEALIVGYYYNFDKPVVTNGIVIDNFGNNFPTSIQLKLVNPQYDLSRNGVYWLLQNQTLSSGIDPQRISPSYIRVGVYPNQFDYGNQYPKAPTTTSYYWEQVAEQSIPPLPVTVAVNAGVTGCLLSSSSTGGIGSAINIKSGTAPQQIVYVPDLRLLPQNSLDESGYWSYLVNNYSINILDGSNQPILTPYRTSSNFDASFGCTQDPNDSNNYFTYLSDITPHQSSTVNLNLYSDTQFITYINYVTQIQTGVVSHSSNSNAQFSPNSNPFMKS